MDIEQIILLIENHGISLVISSGVIFYLFKLTNLFYGKLERKIIKDHAKDLKEKWPQTIEKNTIVHQLLYKAMYEFKGDRAYIFEYHNGGHSISGIDFLKCSNTFEVVNDRIAPKQVLLQNLPVSMFAFWNLRILKKEPICAPNIEEMKEADIGFYQIMKQQEIKGVYMIGLYDAQGNPIGFFGIDYTRNTMPSCEASMRKSLEILSYKIAGLLY